MNQSITQMFSLYRIFLALFICRLSMGFEYFLSNISGKVTKENFVYYSMPYEGTILLELISLTGDCDLYVSQNTKKPSYEAESNCLSSITCGVDSVIISKSFERPVGIGIYGHPSHEVCTYNLIFYRIDDSRDIFNFDPYKDSFQSEMNKRFYDESRNSDVSESEEDSIGWVFLRSVVVFLIENIL